MRGGAPPSARLGMGITICVSALAYRFIPNALSSPAFNVLDAWPGGSRFWFLMLIATSAVQTILFWLQQLHWHPFALWAEGGVLFAIGISLTLAAIDRSGQGGGGAVLFLGLAIIHLLGVPQALRDRRL